MVTKTNSKMIYIYIYIYITHFYKISACSSRTEKKKTRRKRKGKERPFIGEHIFKLLWFDRDSAQIVFFYFNIFFFVVWTLRHPCHLGQTQPLDVMVIQVSPKQQDISALNGQTLLNIFFNFLKS
jgi:hypothetical protein